jgi:hypothetical protein
MDSLLNQIEVLPAARKGQTEEAVQTLARHSRPSKRGEDSPGR